MNKPRVLIAMHYLHLGGAETALIGLLHAWDYERADVDLFLYARRGELLPELPPEVNLLPELADYRAIESPVAEALRSGRLGVVYGRLRARLDYIYIVEHELLCGYGRRYAVSDYFAGRLYGKR